MARPCIYDPDDLADKLAEYTSVTDEPLIQEFCMLHNVSRDTLYRLEKSNEALSDNIKKALEKQETFLIRNGSTGKINPVFAIFRLKQPTFGYTDKADIKLTATTEQPDPDALEASIRDMIGRMTPEQKQLLLGE